MVLKRAVFIAFLTQNRRFAVRFVTKLRMYYAAAVFHSGIWKSTKNLRFLFSVQSYLDCKYQSVRVPIDRGPFKFANFNTRGADGLVLLSF